MSRIAAVTLLVRDYDEAIHFFTQSLRFQLAEDTPLENGKRWVLVEPSASKGAALLLAKAVTPAQMVSVGNQTGGRIFLFLHTQNFWDDYRHMQAKDVVFIEEPREEAYGTVVVFFGSVRQQVGSCAAFISYLTQTISKSSYSPCIRNYREVN